MTVEKSSDWTDPQGERGGVHTRAARTLDESAIGVDGDLLRRLRRTCSATSPQDVETLFTWTKPTARSRPATSRSHRCCVPWGSNQVLSDFRGFLDSVIGQLHDVSDGRHADPRDVHDQARGGPARRAVPEPHLGRPRPGMRITSADRGRDAALGRVGGVRQARYWRALAAFNGIDDPLRVAPGTSLVIPPARDAARLS